MKNARNAVFASLLFAGTMFVSAANASSEGKRVILLTGPTQDRLINGFATDFRTTAEKAGMKVTLFTSPFDPALQAQQIDDAVGQKPDMIVVQPLSSKAVVPALTRAKAAGVPVFLAIAPLEGDASLYVGAAGLDDEKSGALAAESLIDGLKKSGRDKANVAAITGSLAEGIAPIRLKGFKDRLAKESWIKLVQVEDAQWNPQKTESIAGQLLARYAAQGGLDGVYGMNDAQANAIIQAADSAGVTPGVASGDLIVVGGGCQETGIRNIKAGKQFATLSGPLPSFDGPAAAQNVAAYFDGKTFPKLVVTPLEIITAANLDKYAKPCSF
jgi:ribose transport system substrate-binding protein